MIHRADRRRPPWLRCADTVLIRSDESVQRSGSAGGYRPQIALSRPQIGAFWDGRPHRMRAASEIDVDPVFSSPADAMGVVHGLRGRDVADRGGEARSATPSSRSTASTSGPDHPGAGSP